MSSTDGGRGARAVSRFWQRRLRPAAERLKARGVGFFPRGPEREAESWYVAGPPAEAPELVEIPLDGCADLLRRHWEEAGLPELAALADELVELARACEIEAEESADVSPFVYVMY